MKKPVKKTAEKSTPLKSVEGTPNSAPKKKNIDDDDDDFEMPLDDIDDFDSFDDDDDDFDF